MKSLRQDFKFPCKSHTVFYFDDGLYSKISVGEKIDSYESSLIDYDGDLDIVVVAYNAVNGLISLLKNEDGSFVHKYLPNTPSFIGIESSIDYGDIDGDGIAEFLVGDFASDGCLAVLKVF